MLTNLWAWLLGLVNPLSGLSSPGLIQPQERLKQGYQAPIAPAEGPWEDIVTGVYGSPPLLKIHDRQGLVKWSWDRDDVSDKQQLLPKNINRCLKSVANDATELKWLRNGTALAAIYSHLVMIVNHTPDDPSTDKRITFAVCRQNEHLWNAHSLEMLPGDRIAVATTGHRSWDGILVYNASTANPVVNNAPVIQNITGLPGIHGMIWDETEQLLWAAGTDVAPDGSDNKPAHAVLQGYPFDSTTGKLRKDESLRFRYERALDESTEWGKNYGWWSGPHDLVPVPDERKFLLSNDRDIFSFDLDRREYAEEGEELARKYLPGFQVTSNDRHGYHSSGKYEELPRSDLKSFNLAPDGTYLYIQSVWKEYRSNHTSIVIDGVRHVINEDDRIYRSRWFADLPGWPKPV